jgi:hypothetical protein
MKIKLLTLAFFFQNLVSVLGIPQWQWAATPAANGDDRAYNTCVDPSGNIICVGVYTTQIAFGNTILTNSGSDDVFVVRYDQAGNVIWAKSFSGQGNEFAGDVRCDANGNIFIAGYFTETSLTIGTFTLQGDGSKEAYIVKMDANGNVLWAVSFGGNGDDAFTGLWADKNNNIFVTGNFTSPSITFGNTTLLAVGTSKAFVVKIDNSTGNALWAAGSKGGSFDAGKCVTTDVNGNIYFCGEYYQFAVIFDTDTLANNGEDDVFIAKYDSTGNELWVKSAGSLNSEKITAVVAEDNGDVYIAGHFYSPFIQFGPFTINNPGYPAWNLYLVKMDNSGNVLWAHSDANTDEDVIADMTRGPDGNLYAAGWYGGTLSLGNSTLTSAGSIDIFVSKIDTAGNFIWAISAGGVTQNYSNSISVDNNGDIVTGGFFETGSMTFGGNTIGGLAPWNMFIAKLAEPTGINSAENFSFSVFPVPASDHLYVVSNSASIYKLTIYDQTGKQIYYAEKNGMDYSIGISDFADGIYYLKLENNQAVINRKFIVQH